MQHFLLLSSATNRLKANLNQSTCYNIYVTFKFTVVVKNIETDYKKNIVFD